MLTRGTVFFAENFQFSDNTTGRKLLVLLNNPSDSDNLFFVKTTSKQHSKPATAGCVADYHKVYFIESRNEWFKENTWIQLDDWFLIENNHATSNFIKKGSLAPKCIDCVVKCFLEINELDMSPKMMRYLVPSVQQGINALAAKFNK